jgi:tRNA-uridine 2-sulfurtransferase
MTEKIAVALSGGIDSLVAAYLLKQQFKDIIAIHFLTGYEKTRAKAPLLYQEGMLSAGCFPLDVDGSHPMSAISRQLDIPVMMVDCRLAFQQHIIDYFIDDYISGKTPNPCMICNARIKFGRIADMAKDMGATHLATGHYARIAQTSQKRYHIKRGADAEKDQSYFLALLSQQQLAFALFPLGEMTKIQVRDLARKKGLQPLSASESQDICFIAEGDYLDFLSSTGRFQKKPGPIMTSTGTIIGEHNGVHRYTVGQRKGLNCPAKRPYYVLGIDPVKNTVTVGFKEERFRSHCRLVNINWMLPEPSVSMPVLVRIRYRQTAVPAVIEPLEDKTAMIRFAKPQPAVAPGQVAVAYGDDDLIIAGGFIND